MGLAGRALTAAPPYRSRRHAPDALKAVITLLLHRRRFAMNIHYRRCLLNENLGWGRRLGLFKPHAPDPALRPTGARCGWNTGGQSRFLPCALAAPSARDAYWKARIGDRGLPARFKSPSAGGRRLGDPTKTLCPSCRKPCRCQKDRRAVACINYPHSPSRTAHRGTFCKKPFAGWDRWFQGHRHRR